MTLSQSDIEVIVRAAVAEALATDARMTLQAPTTSSVQPCDDVCAPKPVEVVRLHAPLALPKIIADSPARLAQGRTGTRYTTAASIMLRAEHAIAIDAVHAELDAAFAASIGCVALETRATDKQSYLLYPNLGRRLSDASVHKLPTAGARGVDVTLIVGDGLSAWAVQQQAATLVPLLQQQLQRVGLSVGKPLFVKYARIGVADEIGVALASKSTVMIVGERPGLGTGDSLSIYTAFAPRLDQDNAEKNCISNIRPLGVSVEIAAARCADLMKRTFAAGGGGIHLVQPQRDVFKRAAL